MKTHLVFSEFGHGGGLLELGVLGGAGEGRRGRWVLLLGWSVLVSWLLGWWPVLVARLLRRSVLLPGLLLLLLSSKLLDLVGVVSLLLLPAELLVRGGAVALVHLLFAELLVRGGSVALVGCLPLSLGQLEGRAVRTPSSGLVWAGFLTLRRDVVSVLTERRWLGQGQAGYEGETE